MRGLPGGWRRDLHYKMSRHHKEEWAVYAKDLGNGFTLYFFNPVQPAGWGYSRAEVSLYRGPGWFGLPDALFRSFAYLRPEVSNAKSLEEVLDSAEKWAVCSLSSKLSDEERYLETNRRGVEYRQQRVKELQAVIVDLLGEQEVDE